MHVKLVSYSKATDGLLGVVSNNQSRKDLENLVAFCARVSNPSNQMNTETNDRLLRYLMKHKHWSPFEMVNVCLEVDTTRDIARQLLRHRSFTFQEFSQRYAEPDSLGFPFVLSEARLQDTKNRQNSIEVDDSELQEWWVAQQKRVLAVTQAAYSEAIEKGLAKEVARKVLPEGLTKSRLYVNGTLRSWLHYIDLRSANGTQKEHIELAKACAEVIANLFPYIRKVTHD